MISGTRISIESKKFPILDGEKEELINENMYGKALCQYLEQKLPKFSIEVPSFFCEDWGWWIDVISKDFKMGLCIYSHPDDKNNPERYAILSSITNEKKWVWSKLKRVDVSEDVKKIMDCIENIFKNDPDINKVERRNEDFPF